MKRVSNTKLLLLAIVLLGSFLRLYQLGAVPEGLHRDEAFLGYNAYSILKTGRDMNGAFLPLHLRSFVNSPALYAYFAIPPIAIFGLTPFAVRFPSAFFGTLTILATYALTRKLFSKHTVVPLLSSLILAILPWHITLSRTATENVVATFFIVLGTYEFLYWEARGSKRPLLYASLCFIVTLLLYQAPRAFLPLYLPILFLIKAKDRGNIKLLGTIYLIAIVFPLLFIILSPRLSLRLRTVSIAASSQTKLAVAEYIREDGVKKIPIAVTRAFHNKFLGYSNEFLENYFSHFSYPFLFTDKGLPDRYRVPNAAPVYLLFLPFLLVGIYKLLSEKNSSRPILLSWILLAPIGSALTFDDVPNLQRTILMTPTIAILTGIGISETYPLWRRIFQNHGKIFITILGTAGLVSFIAYLHAYFVHMPIHKTWFRQEGYAKLVEDIKTRSPQYHKIIVTNRESAPTIFFLFYLQFDPKLFQQQTKSAPNDDRDRIEFDTYVFSTEECPLKEIVDAHGFTHLSGDSEALYVNYATCKTPPGTQELSTIDRGDGSAVFRVLRIAD